MITLKQARQAIDKKFNQDFAGMLVSEECYQEFIQAVMDKAFNGHVNTSENAVKSAYASVKRNYFGVQA